MSDEQRRFVLPKTRAATTWVKTTDALRGEIKARRDLLAAEVRSKTTEVEQLDQALHYLNQILPPRTAAASTGPTLLPTGGWSHHSSVQVDACIDCARSDVPHVANGRCRTCDGRWRSTRQASA